MRYTVQTLLIALILSIATTKLYDFDLDDANSKIFDAPILLEVGDQLRLVVDENLSTGYQWKYKSF
jgi:hypothetical protein